MLYLLIKVWNSIHEAIYDAESGCLGQWPKHPDSVSAEQFLGRTFCAVVGGFNWVTPLVGVPRHCILGYSDRGSLSILGYGDPLGIR